MKPEFHEDFVSDHADPTAEPYYDFDWDELYSSLGEATDDDMQLRVRLALAFRRVFRWVLSTNLNNKNAAQYVGRRTIALAWVTNPELFDGKSLTEVATALGLPKQILSKASSAASLKFGIQNRGQAHGWNRGKHASKQLIANQNAATQAGQPLPISMPDNAHPIV